MIFASEVHSDRVTLLDKTSIPCGLVVWSTGLAPRPFTRDLKVKKNERGQILTDKHLQASQFAIGTDV